ncbi:hypothetical protein E2542_SST14442 [Spatholobus suberectus]|nr:hypothetical protein E2542_SST14442 [Spatholobus suberectus]
MTHKPSYSKTLESYINARSRLAPMALLPPKHVISLQSEILFRIGICGRFFASNTLTFLRKRQAYTLWQSFYDFRIKYAYTHWTRRSKKMVADAIILVREIGRASFGDTWLDSY